MRAIGFKFYRFHRNPYVSYSGTSSAWKAHYRESCNFSCRFGVPGTSVHVIWVELNEDVLDVFWPLPERKPADRVFLAKIIQCLACGFNFVTDSNQMLAFDFAICGRLHPLRCQLLRGLRMTPNEEGDGNQEYDLFR